MTTLLESNLYALGDILVPIFICCVLPCMIVLFVTRAQRNEINRKTEVALKAIESGAQVDPYFFAKKEKSAKKKVFNYLILSLISLGLGLAFCVVSIVLFAILKEEHLLEFFLPGGILVFIGLSLLVIYFIASRYFAAEIKAEEEKIGKAE